MAVTDRNDRFSPLTTLGDGVLLLCAMAGFVLSFLSLYGDGSLPLSAPHRATPLDLCAAQASSFLGLSVIFALAALCLWSLPRFRNIIAAGLTALWALLALSNRKAAVQGAALTVRTISAQFAQRVSWGRVFSYESGLTLAKEGIAVRLFFTLALALLALVLGWAVVRARRWWLALLFTLPPLLPGLLADLYPDWLPFMALASCWCAMLLCDLCKWAAPDHRGRLTLAVLPCVGLVLALITFAFPREGYTRPQWALAVETRLTTTGNRLSDFFSRLDGPFRSAVTYVGAAEEADLAGAGPLNYSGRTVLRVTSDYSDRLYLRGSSLAVYEGGVWKALPEGTWQEYLDTLSDPEAAAPPLLFPALSAHLTGTYTATVENVGSVGACVYAPYFLIPQDWAEAGMLPVEDSYLARRSGRWNHTITFGTLYFKGAGHTPPEATAYRNYARTHYLDVPETLRPALNEVLLQYDWYRGDPVGAAWSIAVWLDARYEYDPETPAAPEGVDPVEYFLTESHRGYCMHFASAAALLLRAMGIPARYVSGFTAVPQPGKTVDVPDRAAHAWVEVWIEGFGWYPVEVTPAAAFEWYQQGELTPIDLPSDPVEESQEPDPTPTPSDEAAPSAAPSQGPQGGDEDGPGKGSDLTILIDIAKALAGIAGIAALLWLAQFLPKYVRARRLSGPDRNRAALYGYGCLERLERWGGRVNERAVELAQKAKFSRHTLTREELDELRALVDVERERLCVILDPIPRLVFRCLWGMPKRPKRREEGDQPPENPG